MKIEEMNAIRAEVRNTVLPTFLSAFPTAVNVPGTNDYYVMVGDKYVKFSLSVAQWYDTQSKPAFNLDATIAEATDKLAEKEAKRIERENKPKKASGPVDHTDFDNTVYTALASMTEPMTTKVFYDSCEWPEEFTKGKVTVALKRLTQAGRVVATDDEHGYKVWSVA